MLDKMTENPLEDLEEEGTPEGEGEAGADPEGGEDSVAGGEPEGELVVSLDGEEAPPDEYAEIEAVLEDKGRNALKALRDAKKQDSARIRELEAALAAKEAAAPKALELVKPTLEDCGFNEEVFADKMSEYLMAKRKEDERKAKEAEDAKARDTAYREKLAKYNEDRVKVGVDDDAQAVVVSALNQQQQAALMDASMDPAKVVAALAKSPKALAELAGVKEIHRFTYKLAQIEGKITVTTKTPPPPESKLKGGASNADPLRSASLDKLRDEAERTGDYTKYFAEKRRRSAKA